MPTLCDTVSFLAQDPAAGKPYLAARDPARVPPAMAPGRTPARPGRGTYSSPSASPFFAPAMTFSCKWTGTSSKWENSML